MGHIYRNVGPLDFPPGAQVNHHDNRVFIKCITKKGRPGYRKIGELASPGKMYPNDYFRFKFPDLWEAATGVRPPPYELRVGLYLVYLAIALQSGLYDSLINSFGVKLANAVLDYAMLNAIDRSDATYILAEDMKGDLLFSPRAHCDEWYSERFETMGDARIWKFKREWIKTLSTKGHDSAWLCIDSSNSDCHRKNSNLCRLGHSKSNSGSPVVGYIWAVEANNGIPVTWTVNPGSMVDFKAVDEIVKFLSANSMIAKGLIFDRGFCALKVLKLARKKNYEYVAMLKDSTIGYRTMFKNHADELRWKVDRKLPGVAIFGTVDKTKVFEECDWEDNVGLYWDSTNANERALTLTNQVEAMRRRLENGLETEAKGHFKGFFTIEEETIEDENGSIKVSVNYENLQKAVDSKGFSAIASSIEMDAASIRATYYLRDNSEKGFFFLKPQLGYDSARVHSDAAVKGKFAAGFVSTVLRTYFEAACKKFGLATNFAIRELDSIVLHMGRDNLYEAIHNASAKTLLLLKSFGVTPATLEALAVEVNSDTRLKDEQRKLPVELAALTVKEGRGRPRKIKTEPEEPKRPRGRPKGSKNKKTLEKEALMASLPPAVKRKPGRPKGSKNKKTLEKEALAAKPKRGRPKGSRNKTPEEKAALRNAPKRPRGRPRKNKADDIAAMQSPENSLANTRTDSTVDKNPTLLPPVQPNVESKVLAVSTAGTKPDSGPVGNPSDNPIEPEKAGGKNSTASPQPSLPYINREAPSDPTVNIEPDDGPGGNPHDTSIKPEKAGGRNPTASLPVQPNVENKAPVDPAVDMKPDNGPGGHPPDTS